MLELFYKWEGFVAVSIRDVSFCKASMKDVRSNTTSPEQVSHDWVVLVTESIFS